MVNGCWLVVLRTFDSFYSGLVFGQQVCYLNWVVEPQLHLFPSKFNPTKPNSTTQILTQPNQTKLDKTKLNQTKLNLARPNQTTIPTIYMNMQAKRLSDTLNHYKICALFDELGARDAGWPNNNFTCREAQVVLSILHGLAWACLTCLTFKPKITHNLHPPPPTKVSAWARKDNIVK